MRKHRKITTTVEDEYCDVCGKEIDNSEYDVEMCVIYSPEYETMSTVYESDICIECFRNKVAPLLKKELKIELKDELGFTP